MRDGPQAHSSPELPGSIPVGQRTRCVEWRCEGLAPFPNFGRLRVSSKSHETPTNPTPTQFSFAPISVALVLGEREDPQDRDVVVLSSRIQFSSSFAIGGCEEL